MRFKDRHTDPHGVSNELLLGLMVAQGVYAEEGVEMVITALCNGAHSETSLHYSGNAADLRVWHLDDHRATAREIKRRLNRHYDVIAENRSDGSPSHIHMEYQPRRRDRAA